MERYRTYFKWAGGPAIAYAGLLLASWLVMAIGLGPGVYELAAPTECELFKVYAYAAAFVLGGAAVWSANAD